MVVFLTAESAEDAEQKQADRRVSPRTLRFFE
jgi:hypothetical protein